MDFIDIIFLCTFMKFSIVVGSVHLTNSNTQNDFIFCQMGPFTSRNINVCLRTCSGLKGTFSSELNKLVCFDQQKSAQSIRRPEHCQCGYRLLHHCEMKEYNCTPDRKFPWHQLQFHDCTRVCNEVPALILNKFKFPNVTVHCEKPVKVYDKLGFIIGSKRHEYDHNGKRYLLYSCECGLHKISGPETTFSWSIPTNVNSSRPGNDTRYYYAPAEDGSLHTTESKSELQLSRPNFQLGESSNSRGRSMLTLEKRAARKHKISRSMKLSVACPMGPFVAKNIDVCMASCRNTSAAFSEDGRFFCFNSVKKVEPMQLTDSCTCGINHQYLNGQYHPCIPERKYPLEGISSSAGCVQKCDEFSAFTYKQHKSQHISAHCESPTTRVIEKLDGRYGPTDPGIIIGQDSQDRCECGLRNIPGKDEFIAKCSMGSFDVPSIIACKQQCHLLSGKFSSDANRLLCFNRERPVTPITNDEYCQCGYMIWEKEEPGDHHALRSYYPCVPEIKTPWVSIKTKTKCHGICQDYTAFILRKSKKFEAHCLLSKSAVTFKHLEWRVRNSANTISNSTEEANKRVTCECGLKSSSPSVPVANNIITSNTSDDEPLEQTLTNYHNFLMNDSNFSSNDFDDIPENSAISKGKTKLWNDSNVIPSNSAINKGKTKLWNDSNVIPSDSATNKGKTKLWNDSNVIPSESATNKGKTKLWNDSYVIPSDSANSKEDQLTNTLNAINDSREYNSLTNNSVTRKIDCDDERVLDSVLTVLLNGFEAHADTSLDKIFQDSCLGGGNLQPVGDFDMLQQCLIEGMTTSPSPVSRDFNQLDGNEFSREMLSKRSIETSNSEGEESLPKEKRRKN